MYCNCLCDSMSAESAGAAMAVCTHYRLPYIFITLIPILSSFDHSVDSCYSNDCPDASYSFYFLWA